MVKPFTTRIGIGIKLLLGMQGRAPVELRIFSRTKQCSEGVPDAFGAAGGLAASRPIRP
jgi:hypothetical protein